MGDYSFSQVPTADIPRSTFNRSYGHKTTFDSGYLIPVYLDEVLPGDTYQVKPSLFARLATPIKPIMDNLHMDVFWFFVPNRLLWDKWQRFMGEQDNPADSTDFLVPIVSSAGAIGNGSIYDYMGWPSAVAAALSGSALPFRAYNLIWNKWFRDENLQNSVNVNNSSDGPDAFADYSLLRRGKRHDYFTSCLPWPQKGVSPPLLISGTLPVKTSATATVTGVQAAIQMSYISGGTPPTGFALATQGASGETAASTTAATVAAGNRVYPSNLFTDLSAATANTINALRFAFQVQKLMERDARGGTRYVEILKSHFGVTSPDARLQRPEFLGGGTVPVHINPVVQTSNSSAGNTFQGNLAAYGVASANAPGFSKSFVEHGWIMGLVSVRADLSYQQGMNRMHSRRTRYDFYWPEFAHIGEQAVLNKEIYMQGDANDPLVFGYQERWAEYRYHPSQISGLFRSQTGSGLDIWHLAQKFTALPTLGATFIQDTPPVSRVVAVPSDPQFLFDSHFAVKCTRPMPTYSVPGLIDHF